MLGLPWARDTAAMAERNGDQGWDGERAAGLPRSTLMLPGQGRPLYVPIHFHLSFGGIVLKAAQVSVLVVLLAQAMLPDDLHSLLVWSLL